MREFTYFVYVPFGHLCPPVHQGKGYSNYRVKVFIFIFAGTINTVIITSAKKLQKKLDSIVTIYPNLKFFLNKRSNNMTEKIKPIPDGYHAINIHIALKDAAKAITFYKEAFGAEEKIRFNMPDGRIMFAELRIGDSTLQLSNEVPEHEFGLASPLSLKGTNCIIHLYVKDADVVFESAIKAGAKVKRQIDNMFWGDRYGQLEDPFGYLWSISTRIEEVTPQQLKDRLSQLFAEANQK